MLCNTTIIRYLNKPTQSKTHLTQRVVDSFNTYYTHIFAHALFVEVGRLYRLYLITVQRLESRYCDEFVWAPAQKTLTPYPA